MIANGRLSRKWLILIVSFSLAIVAAGGVLFWRARHMDDFVRLRVIRSLSERFQSRVELTTLRVTGFPYLGVSGEDLTIYTHDRSDLPPLIHIDRFSFGLGMAALLELPKHVSSAQIENMTITIPPPGERKIPGASKDSGKKDDLLSSLVFDEIVCKNTVLVTLPRKPDPGKPQKDPLEWDIHDLILQSASLDKPFHFHGTLTNAKPKGEISTSGEFGPWDVDEPASTPVSGSYQFTDADLGPFPGIAGILSSTGKFHGEIQELQVEGETDTPDFSLDKIGKAVPLHAEFSATVDGTNGDTVLHPVQATLVRSLIIAQGSIIREPAKKGHRIVLDVSAPNARIQDILSLAMKSDKPVLTGTAKLKAKLVIPASKEKAIDKLILDGQIGIDDAEWSSSEVRQKLEALSRRAEGKPEDNDAGSAVSDLHGNFHMEKGVIRFTNLTFSVPGAAIELAGTYNVVGGDLDFQGQLRLQAKLSQMVTGTKSFFLKALDPFFKKDGAGTVLPISITGTRDNPTVGVTVFHKKIEKHPAATKAAAK
jgi:hypothetical protein